MSQRSFNHLKFHGARATDNLLSEQQTSTALAEICRGFEQVTGWPLRYVPAELATSQTDPLWSAPVNPGVGVSPGLLMIGSDVSAGRGRSRVHWNEGVELATGLAELLGELSVTRRALDAREAELAAGVPVVIRTGEHELLAWRLQSVLQAGATAVGADSAGLYLLDAATTELKLRASWKLPSERLLAPARPLVGAIADLEALTGHAVALENSAVFASWQVPEPCQAAICVPVSTSSALLGTLWLFCDEVRDFTDHQTGLAEIVAGRIAADLEREMLLTQGVETDRFRRQLNTAQRIQETQTPRLAPLLEGWELAGWTRNGEMLGGDFFDWSVLPDGQLVLSIGDALDGGGAAAALVASSLRTGLRAHAQYESQASRVLDRANRTLWTGCAGDQFAAALVAKLEPQSGALQLATAGQLGALLLDSHGATSLSQANIPLALHPETAYRQQQRILELGSVLVLYTDGVRNALGAHGQSSGESVLAETLLPHLKLSAQQLLERLTEQLAAPNLEFGQDDCTVVVIRRKPHLGNGSRNFGVS